MAVNIRCGVSPMAFGICSSPGLNEGEHYKYEIKNYDGHIYEKSDPYGFQQETRPKTASIVANLDKYDWHDDNWMEQRRQTDPLTGPISVYEVHLGSWLHESSANPALQPDGSKAPVGDRGGTKAGCPLPNLSGTGRQTDSLCKRAGFHPCGTAAGGRASL